MTKPKSSSRLPFLGMAVLFALLIAALGGTSFQRQVDTFQPLGFDFREKKGVWQVTEVFDAMTGLLVGDGIVRHDKNSGEFQQSLRGQEQTNLLVMRGDGIESVDYQRPDLAIDLPYLILAGIGVLYLLIGLYTALKDTRLPARLFYFWCLLSAAAYILRPVNPPQDSIDKIITLIDQFALIVLAPLTLHLFLVFPSPFSRRPAVRFALPGLYLPAALLLAFHVDQAFAGAVVFGKASVATLAWVLRLELWFPVLFGILSALVVLVRLTSGTQALRTQASGTQTSGTQLEQRRQMQWILVGMLGGYVPFMALYVTPFSLGLGTPVWSEALGVLFLALVPLGFAYAILKYKLWDIGVILRDSISYSLTVLVGLCGFALIHMAIQRGLAQEMAMARNFLTYAAGLVIAGVLVPTRGAISSSLERFQYRKTLPQRQALGALGEELLYERDLARLCTTLIHHLSDGLVARANLYLVKGSDALAVVRPSEDLPREIHIKAVGEDVWHRDVTSISPIQMPGAEPSAAAEVFAAGYRYAFPLLVREHRVGILLVSYKFDDEPLSSEDLELTRGLLNQASLAIENAHLIEEVHRRLEEVGRLEEHSKGIIESSPVGIAVLDDDDRVVSANQTFSRIVEKPVEMIAGVPLEDSLPIKPLPRAGEGLMEVSFGEASGRERYLQLSMAPYELEEEPLRILIVQDTSDLIAMENALKEKERLASLGLLAAGVAHEVNTPLTGISSYAQLMLSDVDESHPHFEILKKVERQTFRAAQIVNNLLEFSRNRHDDLAPVNLASVLQECLNMLDERLQEASVRVKWEVPKESLRILGHEGELHQVFTNLMVNAIDAMADSQSEPHHLTVRLERRQDRLVTWVTDTGPGIAPERLERVFQPFFSSKMGKGGTGLGLAIVYNIVRRHRGTIRAENHPGGVGCTFTVDLPGHEVH